MSATAAEKDQSIGNVQAVMGAHDFSPANIPIADVVPGPLPDENNTQTAAAGIIFTRLITPALAEASFKAQREGAILDLAL